MFSINKKKFNKERVANKWRDQIHKVTSIMFLSVMILGLGANVVLADDSKKSGFKKVYHIYSAGEHVGTISDITKLEEMKEKVVLKAGEEFKEYSLTAGSGLSIVPESVFTSITNDEVVLEKIQTLLAVETEAIAVVIDEKPAFYVKDMDAYKEVIRQLKLQSVTEEQLSAFETQEASEDTLPELAVDETRIIDISISGDMKADKASISPDQVRNIDEAIQILNKGTLDEKKYTVQPGDVLGKIAVAHNMTTAELLKLNPNYTNETVLHLDEELNVTVLKPFVNVEVNFETKQKEQIKYKVTTKEDDQEYKGKKVVTVQGSDGEKIVTAQVQKVNGQLVAREVTNEEVLTEAVDEVVVVGTKVVSSKGTGQFVWPTNGGYVSSQRGARWGRVHEGIDIARPSNFTIKAADNGVVSSAGAGGTYGNRIVITHNNGYQTLYAHLSKIDVKVGQTVERGSAIGVMGATGNSTGVHLHFEVLKNGSNINPLSVLN